MVRRDWCDLARQTCSCILDQILSGLAQEELVRAILAYLTDLGNRTRANQVPITDFVVTKGLKRHIY